MLEAPELLLGSPPRQGRDVAYMPISSGWLLQLQEERSPQRQPGLGRGVPLSPGTKVLGSLRQCPCPGRKQWQTKVVEGSISDCSAVL